MKPETASKLDTSVHRQADAQSKDDWQGNTSRMTNDEERMYGSTGGAVNIGEAARAASGHHGAASGRHVTFSRHTDTRATALDYIQASPAFDSLCCYTLRRLRIRHQSLANH